VCPECAPQNDHGDAPHGIEGCTLRLDRQVSIKWSLDNSTSQTSLPEAGRLDRYRALVQATPGNETSRDQTLRREEIESAIGAEVKQLQSQIKIAARAQFIRSTAWGRVSLIMNLLAAVLAGVAGVGTLAQSTGPVVAGTAALLAAVLSAANSALGAEKRAASASEAANGYIELRDGLRQLVNLDMRGEPIAEVRTELATITARLHAINKGVEPPGQLVWTLAHRSVRRESSKTPTSIGEASV
jgi:hypothetical protein